MQTRHTSENGDGQELTIRQISARSGVSEGTLRMWESRYGFPKPQRLASGHRRYSDQDLEQVRAVVRAREQGLSLPSAIEHASTLSREGRPSVYSVLRECYPQLQPRRLPKRALVALSHAVEDESCARGQHPLLLACFQHERFYRQAERRWRELSRTAETAIVLADFAKCRQPARGPAEVAVTEADPLLREWVLVCESPGLSACLVGWERLSDADVGRWFETVWSVEPQVVRTAARTCCELVARAAPDYVATLKERLGEPASSASTDLRAVLELTTRMVLYAAGGERSSL